MLDIDRSYIREVTDPVLLADPGRGRRGRRPGPPGAPHRRPAQPARPRRFRRARPRYRRPRLPRGARVHPRARRGHGQHGGHEARVPAARRRRRRRRAFAATLATWFVAVRIIESLADNVSALKLQAATGLLAIVVLLDRDELVLPQGLLDRLDLDAQPAQAAADAGGARAPKLWLGPRAARLLVGVSRGIRGRALPAELPAASSARRRCCPAWRSASR